LLRRRREPGPPKLRPALFRFLRGVRVFLVQPRLDGREVHVLVRAAGHLGIDLGGGVHVSFPYPVLGEGGRSASWWGGTPTFCSPAGIGPFVSTGPRVADRPPTRVRFDDPFTRRLTLPEPMSIFRDLEAHRDLVLDALRVYLGTGLFFRGLALLATENGLQQLVGTTEPGLGLAGLTVYVTTAHLVGGTFLAVGLYTRIAALVQLPILVGAVFLVHWHDGLLSANQSLEFSALVLFLLVLVCTFGSGRWSLDARWRRGPAPMVPTSSRRHTAQK